MDICSVDINSFISCIRILAFIKIACFTCSIAQVELCISVKTTFTLICPFPPLDRVWLFDGSNYLADICEIHPLVNSIINFGETDLQIVNVSCFDEGTYSCINFYKPVALMEIMKIKDIPDVPTNITTKTFIHSVSVSWQPGNSGNLHQVFYIQYREEGGQIWTTIGPLNQTGSNYMTYQIPLLPYNRSHVIQVFAENDVGRSKCSELVKFVVLFENEVKTIGIFQIELKYWLILGLTSVGLILICIVSQVWRHHRTHISVDATLALHTEAPYDEIDSFYYQEHPPVPHTSNNVIISASTVETESRNNVLAILNNDESEVVQEENINLDYSSQRNARANINTIDSSSTDDSNSGTESGENSSDDQTIRPTSHVNVYTSIMPERHADHPYSHLNVGNTEIRVHNDNDYVNMRI